MSLRRLASALSGAYAPTSTAALRLSSPAVAGRWLQTATSSAQGNGGVEGRARLSGQRPGQADVWHEPSPSAQAIGVERHLVIEQVVADAIGLVSGVQGGSHVAHAPRLGALLDAANGGDVTGGVQADQEQGIA
jgi:hypothetical protein